ncbi:hypothetical protein HDU79_002390 [Rhizoclosmatium sp. JEL0117]|nr:hypothetical protein HDU79_002390 [Rhizoclosmatium sp. JEL0117]
MAACPATKGNTLQQILTETTFETPLMQLSLTSASFSLIVLGAAGGPFEDRLTGYLVRPWDSRSLLSFDPGSLLGGIRRSLPSLDTLFNTDNTDTASKALPSTTLKTLITGHLISHPHLDHCAGLLISSQADAPGASKPLYGLNSTLTALNTHAFNNILWPNLPKFGYYHYEQMIPGNITTKTGGIPRLDSLIYPVSHADLTSACFLLGENLSTFTAPSGDAILLCGDLGADVNEKSTLNAKMWNSVAPLVSSKRLKALMIECSFPDSTPTSSLFGHLTPKLVIQELRVLAQAVLDLGKSGCSATVENVLQGFIVIIQHVKESIDAVRAEGGRDLAVEKIVQELGEQNNLGVKFIFAHQNIGGIIAV